MTTDAQKKATLKYKKNHYKRIPLDVTHEYYDSIKRAADSVGEPVNTFIKKSVDLRISHIQDEK